MHRASQLTRVLAIASLTSALGACTTTQPSPFVGLYAGYDDCRERYAEIDAQIDAAGVRDAAFYRVPGYPYMRTDRLLASYAHEVEGLNQVAGWMRRMRELDQEAREFEMRNLGMTLEQVGLVRSRLQDCGRVLAAVELDSPEALAALRDAVQPPPEYSSVARTLGLYPLMAPLLKSHTTREQEQAQAQFDEAAEASTQPPVVRWKAEAVEDLSLVPADFDKAYPDELGIPGLVDSAWRALAETHAPQLWLESADAVNQPGAPVWTDDGVAVDASLPVVHYHFDFARFGGHALARINYFMWFRKAGDDGAAGAGIDGLIWRVTLDRHAKPLLFESLHASGRDHYWFPAQSLQRREPNGYWIDPPLFPQTGLAPAAPVLRLTRDQHELRQVRPANEVKEGPVRTYALKRYEDLYLTATPEGGTRSIFGADGFVAGSDATEPAWLLASGMRRPGALRQYGHHATSLLGHRHFDDPHLLEEVFVAPPPPVAAKSAP